MTKNNKLNNIALIALLLYFIETTIDGTGRMIEFGFLSIQMILFAIAFVATLPLVIKKFKEIITNPCVIAILAFAVVMTASAVIGYKRGSSLTNIRTDITSVLGLALIPGTIATLETDETIKKTVDVLFWFASAFSFVVVILFCLYPVIGPETVEKINSLYRSGNASDGVGLPYAYFRVSALMIFFAAYGVFKLKEKKGIAGVILYVCEASLIMLILLSNERSECLGFAVALMIILICKPKDIGHYLKSGILSLLIIGIMIGFASLTRGELAVIPTVFGKFTTTEVGNSFDYNEFLQSDESAEKEVITEDFTSPEVVSGRGRLIAIIGSDNLRKIIVQRHEYFIKKYPVFGAGLGFDMNFVDGGKSEYMYLDFLMKLGIFGFLAFLAAFFTPVILCFKRILCELRTANSELLPGTRHLAPETLCLLAGYLGMAVTSYFEPYLTNPMGIMILCLLTASVSGKIRE